MHANETPRVKVALVTGASGGIGLAICEVLMERGYAIVAADIDLGPVSQWRDADNLRKNLLPVRADVSAVADCERLVKECLQQFGRLDVLVNNAGICPRSSIQEVTEEQFDRIVSVNLKSCFFLSQKASAWMKQQRSGRIINMASIAGRTGGAFTVSVYAATKAGILALTKSFARELAPYNVLVNAVAPGSIDTRLVTSLPEDQKAKLLLTIPLSRFGQPAEVARVIGFLCSPDSSYITGATVDINGGLAMF
jgi:3-oxoacyl-[acyl-carrier protein] reductase